MLNLSGIPRKSFAGRLLRFPLSILANDLEVRVLQGPLRGKRWITGSGPHGQWIGSYEYEKQREIGHYLSPGQTVFDVGANVGFYTLLFAETVSPSGTVVAFEPAPENLVYLHRHLSLNGYHNVLVAPCALSSSDGLLPFETNTCRAASKLSSAGKLLVPVRSIDSVVTKAEYPWPDVIKLDVEGAEADVLRGAESVLSAGRSVVFVATHGRSVHAECIRLLHQSGYSVLPIGARDLDSTDELVALPPRRLK